MHLSAQKKQAIKAQSFREFLANTQPHLWNQLISPFLAAADCGDRYGEYAASQLVGFIMGIGCFPPIAPKSIDKALRRAKNDHEEFITDELRFIGLVKQGQVTDKRVCEWSVLANAHYIVIHGIIPRKSIWLKEYEKIIFTIFHCLRNSI